MHLVSVMKKLRLRPHLVIHTARRRKDNILQPLPAVKPRKVYIINHHSIRLAVQHWGQLRTHSHIFSVKSQSRYSIKIQCEFLPHHIAYPYNIRPSYRILFTFLKHPHFLQRPVSKAFTCFVFLRQQVRKWYPEHTHVLLRQKLSIFHRLV